MRNFKKLVIGAVSVIMLFGGAYITNYFFNMMKYRTIIKELSISKVDLSKIPDGNFTGSFDAIFVEAKVNVIVKNHKIVDVKLINHKNERGQKAEVIPQKVVHAQSLQVDAVSGATNSSKVILKAIENALISGENK
ncbi:FMN-binding protein [Clostridium magnum]|uniref:FMN-binding domain protein n=1 Tax=Clostridium magnum DSM 2767 TaxID=1121326 RepID=A0A161X970_9CLOT|nr:FMN-binding protein [Clostridium magnum]KZL90766.1 FMN-binding domain protein [Clostridium magnum DSM 2767]SHJ48004.1 Uncharacterized protein, contains FMN-binding domain [Clostridium magnum DSM 2767]